MPFLLTRTNLEDLKTDAKVIGSCPYRSGSFTTDWQPDLWAEQRRIRQMQPGESMVTSGKEFDAKCGIITLPPIWEGGERKETLRLAACYDSSLRLANKRRCKSVAFSLLSGDCNGFPRDLALKTAVDTISEFLQKHEMTVYLSVKDAWVQHLPKPQIPALSEQNRQKRLSTQQLFEMMIRGEKAPEPEKAPAEEPLKPEAPQKQGPFSFLKPRHGEGDSSPFSEALFAHIAAQNLLDPQLCQKANLDRKVLARLRSGQYLPGKSTVVALCLGLELSLSETQEMLQKAGYDFSGDNTFDMIVKHYISQGNYRIMDINQALFVYEQPLLGGE